jgi:hypothetical protein
MLQTWLDQLGTLMSTLENIIDNAEQIQDALHYSTLRVAIDVLEDMAEHAAYELPSNITADVIDILRTLRAALVAANDTAHTPPLISIARRLRRDVRPYMDVSACVRFGEYLQCLRWSDRFVIVANASVVNTVGICLRDWDLYYTAIVFDEGNTSANATVNGSSALTVYTIRMSPDLVGSLCISMCAHVRVYRWTAPTRFRPIRRGTLGRVTAFRKT